MSSLLFPHPDRAANKSAVPKNTTICGLRTSWKRLPDLPPSQQGTPSRCLSRAKKVPLCCCGYKETIAPPSSPLLGTCFASFGKPFKLKTPKDRTAVSSVLSLSLTRACSEGRLQQRTYPLKMSIHLISEVPGAALCAYCSCMLECSGTD